MKLKDTIISSTQEGLKADDANSKKKPIAEKETSTVKEKIVLMQVTVVAAICYYPAELGVLYCLVHVMGNMAFYLP